MSKKVLILSGKEPSHSGGLGQNIIDALKKTGYEVTFNLPDSSIFLNQIKRRQNSFWWRVVTKSILEVNRIFNTTFLGFKGYYSKKGYVFFHADEGKIPYNSQKIIEYAKDRYDLIIALFTKDIFNIKSLGEIYQNTGIPILIYAPDMYPMTGGCIYFNKCQGYKHNCEFCPAFNGKKINQANNNYLIKKAVYQSSDITILLNTWMRNHYVESNLFSENQLRLQSFVLDENQYKPIDRNLCRSELGIPESKMVYLIRHASEKRKGNSIAYNALIRFYHGLDDSSQKNFLLLIIGGKIAKEMSFQTKELGYLDTETLIKVYNAADAFLCPSTDDAGPSMINQSIACGTPVVSFNSGTAMDVIENGISGFKTDDISENGFYICLKQMYDAIKFNGESLRKTTRDMSLKKNSFITFATTIDSIIKYKSNNKLDD